ncbi:LysR family transcriptional regulator [Shewanella sp. C32]|uniref:LysR family transcriptional regulator n=1 Tax=Shewanella electrica TaxID=515560 RepID=A0ABT2FJ40_9GAMM|nr:LysR family transcriptional regulator [Shewanella electrica]MCH1924444.1 LysR family transcriptional regulator [Shewanella electrica]MCS4556345.1 LysR family transcriptional regulator [Shewanella electrica]
MDKLECMKRFALVAQTGSFTQAAERLNVPKSAVSSAVTRLESHLQSRLLQRSTRRVTLTEAGERFLPQCLKLLDEIEGLENQFQQQSHSISGEIRVDMPGRFFSQVLAPRLSEWFAQHPDTRIRLIGADHRIDPIQEQLDCVLRVGTLSDSELIAKKLGELPLVNCVSPSYIARYGRPQQLADLAQHYLIDYSPGIRQQADGFEYYCNGQHDSVAMRSLLSVSTTDAYLAACLAGMGIAQMPLHGANQLIAQGELVTVLPDYLPAPMPVAMLYESRRYQPKRLRLFIEWVASLVAELQ